jgi:signal transduction histidine kinase
MKLSTGLTAAMVALVLLTATAVGLLIYRNVQAEMLSGELERTEIHARALAGELEAHVRSARGDALGFRSAVALAGIVRATLAGGTDPRDGTSAAEWRTRMASRYVAELAAKPSYVDFRIIGIADDGRELVRVYRAGGMIRIATDAELRRVGDAGFFRAAVRLSPGAVYASPIELAQDTDGAARGQREPMLRVATPVHTADGEVFGLVVIGVDLRPAFDLIRSAAKPGQSIFVVNDHGDFLLHPDPSREFGFQFGKPLRWQDELPAFAAALGAAQRGAHVVANASGAHVGAALASARLAQGPRVAVIATVPYAELMAPALAVGQSTLIVGLIAVLLATLLAVLLARSLARPLSQMTRAVEDFGRGAPMAMPTHASHELGVLARAFERMAAEVREKAAAVRRNAEVLDKVVASMADAVLVVDHEGRTVFSNPALVTLFGDHAEVGSPEWRETYHRFRPDGVTPYPPEETPIGRAVRGESFDNLEILMRRKGETQTNYIVASGRPFLGERGAPEGAVIVYRDVTAVKEIELQLRQAHKLDAIGQLTGGVAHDFNNILTVITGTIEILADGVRERPKLSAIAAMIDEAATRGAALTQQLLAFARKQALEPQETDVNALIVETASLLRPTLGEHIEIESMLEDDAWRALIDPSQLSRDAALLVELQRECDLGRVFPGGALVQRDQRGTAVELADLVPRG